MQIDRNPIDELTARLTVTVEPADYESRVEKILNDYRKNSTYPGFRKGKAPMALIRKAWIWIWIWITSMRRPWR